MSTINIKAIIPKDVHNLSSDQQDQRKIYTTNGFNEVSVIVPKGPIQKTKCQGGWQGTDQLSNTSSSSCVGLTARTLLLPLCQVVGVPVLSTTTYLYSTTPARGRSSVTLQLLPEPQLRAGAFEMFHAPVIHGTCSEQMPHIQKKHRETNTILT
eukprot:scaffold16708_cov29-Prasinocladus_malaysianus.AAC.1